MKFDYFKFTKSGIYKKFVIYQNIIYWKSKSRKIKINKTFLCIKSQTDSKVKLTPKTDYIFSQRIYFIIIIIIIIFHLRLRWSLIFQEL